MESGGAAALPQGEAHPEGTPGALPRPVPRVELRRLTVRDFRNLERVDLAVPPDGLTVVGENGHGKTNLLESVYYLELLRSVRGARDADLVRFGAGGFHVAAEVALPAGDADRMDRIVSREVGVGFDRVGKRKRVRIDGAEVPRLSDALGAVPSVIFSPGDVVLVAGSPSERRRYLDVALALTSRRYLAALQAYRGALVRRNAALRDAARSGRGEGRASVWEPALAEHGAVLWTERRRWVRQHAEEFARLCAAIGERAPMRLRYATALDVPADAEGDSAVAGARAALERALADKRPLDLKRGLTHAGPHRDDLELALGGRDLRLFGSAGQQRTAAIALRMLEAATLREHVGSAPLFLLDDPFAELDARRAHRILGLLGDAGLGQVLLVVPRASDVPAELTRLPRAGIQDGVLSLDG
jgi:DNA replication and repair protein RecF